MHLLSKMSKAGCVGTEHTLAAVQQVMNGEPERRHGSLRFVNRSVHPEGQFLPKEMFFELCAFSSVFLFAVFP